MNNKKWGINKDLEVAHQHIILVLRLPLLCVFFFGSWGEGKIGVPGEKPLGAKKRTKDNSTTYGVHARIWTRFECSDHYTFPASLTFTILTLSGGNGGFDCDEEERGQVRDTLLEKWWRNTEVNMRRKKSCRHLKSVKSIFKTF